MKYTIRETLNKLKRYCLKQSCGECLLYDEPFDECKIGDPCDWSLEDFPQDLELEE